MELIIRGVSDDLIELEGCIREEFNVSSDVQDGFVLAVSDGTLLFVLYDRDGIWRINRIVKGLGEWSKAEPDLTKDEYSDRVTISHSTLAWVVFGEQKAIIRG